MQATLTRRSFLGVVPSLAGVGLLTGAGGVFAQSGAVPAAPSAGARTPLADAFPRIELSVIETFVGLAHRDPVEVRRMVERQPALARASWDWGYGDWETGLGAAAHTGGREIAELVLAHGAHPTIFSAAMLGQLDVVKAIVAASPGVQKTPGPHGLHLLHHAKVGGKDAEAVVAYLESVGGADTKATTAPLETADRDALVGRYIFGPGERDHLDVDVNKDQLGIQRPAMTRRALNHTGGLVFFPAGVPSVRIAFAKTSVTAWQLTVADPDVYVTARRQA
jgi:hypothetical protein